MPITQFSKPMFNDETLTEAQFRDAMNRFGVDIDQVAADMEAGLSAMNFNSLNATSSTNMSVATGSKSFTIEASKSWLPGMSFTAARTSDGEIWMRGVCKSYNPSTGAFVGVVSEKNGTGTYNDWSISFGDPSSLAPGSLVLLNEITASSDVMVDIEDGFAAYNKYVIKADKLTFSANGNLYLRIKTGGVYVTSATYAYVPHDTGTAVNSQTRIDMGAGVNSAAGSHTELELSLKNPIDTSISKIIEYKMLSQTAGALATNESKLGMGINSSITALQGIRIEPSAGNLSGVFKLYGVTG